MRTLGLEVQEELVNLFANLHGDLLSRTCAPSVNAQHSNGESDGHVGFVVLKIVCVCDSSVAPSL